MRARLALVAAGIDVELREVLLAHKPRQMLEISAKATVPVLQLCCGKVLDESIDILHWGLDHFDGRDYRRFGANRIKAERLIARNDGQFKSDLDRFKYATRFPDDDPMSSRSRAETFLDDLERVLSLHDHLIDSVPSYADIAIFPFVRQFSRVDAEWFSSTNYEGLRRWLAWWEQDHDFRAVMGKVQAWSPGDSSRSMFKSYGITAS